MCQWCGRDDFISQRGLTYHLERSRICCATAKAASSPDIGAINTKVPLNRHNKGDAIRAKSFHNRCIINDPKSLLKSHDLDDVACVIGAYFDLNLRIKLLKAVTKRPQIQAKINLKPLKNTIWSIKVLTHGYVISLMAMSIELLVIFCPLTKQRKLRFN